MIEYIGVLLGLDLTECNPDIVLVVSSMFLLLSVSAIYDMVAMLFGYIGGKRR